MNHESIFNLFVVAVVVVCLCYISWNAARAFRLDSEAQQRSLDLGTVSYTDAGTYHRKPVPVTVPGSDGYRNFDRNPGAIDRNPRPRTIHRHDVGDRPGSPAPVSNSDFPDAEAMK